jgi:hypothetical protein
LGSDEKAGAVSVDDLLNPIDRLQTGDVFPVVFRLIAVD